MQHSSHSLRIALLAGASVVALVAAAPSAGAADMNKPTLTKAPPLAPAAKERWAWWIEGGAFNPSGDDFSLGARVSNIRPKWGWEAAAGFDWMPGWGAVASQRPIPLRVGAKNSSIQSWVRGALNDYYYSRRRHNTCCG